jgi:hypothetical protein
MELDKPEVVQEVRTVFEAYERALMAHDLPALNGFFHDAASTTRYGIADRQRGYEELAAFRAASAPPDFTRVLENVRISSFGHDFAVAQTEFVRSDTPKRGFQTQTWVRLPGGWKIVAAHVSMIDFP